MRILGVDDDLMARSMIFEALKLVGQSEVFLASSGADALRKIQLSESPFDCFLLDIQMDEMDGIELCERIRKIPEHVETPIIMVTGLQERRYMDLAFKAGATDYISKPFDMMELATRVQIAEKIGQKIKMIARNKTEISKLRNIVETLETKHGGPKIDIAAAGFMTQEVFESTLQQISRSDLINGALVKCQIANFDEISGRCVADDLQALLADVAVAIGNVFDSRDFMATYGGNGMFVILFLQAPPSDRELVQVQENLNKIRLSAVTGCSDFVLLDFGERVFCSQLSASDSFKNFQVEQEKSASRTQSLNVETGAVEDPLVSETPQQKLERRLKRMVPHYMSVLNDAMVRLEKLNENLRTGLHSWNDIEEIERTAHKIAGVAPSLGFSELGTVAADIEKLAADAPGTRNLSRSCSLIETALVVLLDKIEDTIVENFA